MPPGTAASLVSKRVFNFALIFTFFVIFPGFLTARPAFFPLLEVADWVDLVSPFFVVPAYWFLFRLDDTKPASAGEQLAFMAVLIPWLDGHGIHLAANAIGHLVPSDPPSDAYRLTYFLDEHLGHYLWNSGVMGLSTVVLFRQWKAPTDGRSSLYLEGVGAVLYGFTFFCALVEGQTAAISIPYSILVVAFGAVYARKSLRRFPVLAFFVFAHTVAIVLTLIWAARWGGLPEFSQVGIL